MMKVVPMDFETFIRSHFFEQSKIEKNIDSIIHSFVFFSKQDKYIDNQSGETFYRIPYADISKVLFDEQNVFSSTNLDMSRSIILDALEIKIKTLLPNQPTEQKHIISCYKRFTEHMLLASIQKKYVSELTKKVEKIATEAREEVDRAKEKTENITTQFVTILGIFASIIVALFGGMSLIKAAVELLTNEGSLPLFVFVVSVLMLSFSGLIVLLTTWITSLNKSEAGQSYNLTKVVLFSFLIICCVGSGLISYDLSKKPKADKKESLADIKLELKATN